MTATLTTESLVVGRSARMRAVFEFLRVISNSDSTVLITGESGTGKEVTASLIHQSSRRKHHPFVPVSCALFSETLIESELFGHERGAFTGAIKDRPGRFELADTGTIFLDDIDDVPLSMQVKLLRVLQNRTIERLGGTRTVPINVRVLAGTKRDLKQMVAEGKFREDLYYRLNEVRLVIPPLREREGDAILLATYFLKKFSGQFNRKLKGFGSEALAAIATHPWRGNVRELENRVKRAVVMADGAAISAADLELAPTELPNGSLDLREARARAERGVVQMALAQTNGNLSRASKLLGISRPTLYGLLEGLGLEAAS
jgi:two-component system, NtrC family, response regulator